MTQFETYLLFQMNSILHAIGFAGLMMILGAAIMFVGSMISYLHSQENYGRIIGAISTWAHNWQIRALTFGLIGLTLLLASKTLPDRNTIIAMKVIPEITSEKVMTGLGEESKEIYDMFKTWIKSQINEEARKELEEKLALQKSKNK